MLTREGKVALDVLLAGEIGQADRIALAFAQGCAKKLPPEHAVYLDGMVVSHSLRRLGFNRDHRWTGPGVLYRRKAAGDGV